MSSGFSVPDSIWTLFPFPTLTEDGFTTGSLFDVHPDCRTCPQRPCEESASTTAVSVCRYGLGAIRIDDSRLSVGLVPTDHAAPTQRLRKRIRLEPTKRVKLGEVQSAVDHARDLGIGVVNSHEASKAALLEVLKTDQELQASIAAQFRAEHTNQLNQSHDFLQLANLVRGYAESLLHAKHPDLTPEDAAERCPEEGAIYFATLLMRMKVDSLTYLSEINRVHGGETTFSVHPFVLKYVRIYNWQAKQKNLSILLINECHDRVRYNADAVGAVLQGLLDNMVKYAPASSDAAIVFESVSNGVILKFDSLGPRIDDDETDQIFMARYRGRAAGGFETQGQGIGLAAVRQVSEALGLDVTVRQNAEPEQRFAGYHRTVFTIRLQVETGY